MNIKNFRQERRQKIRYRIRKKIIGTAARPRLVTSKSNKNLYLQLIDDTKGSTLAAIFVKGNNKTAGIKAGELIAAKGIEKKVSHIVFDRAGYKYHGVIKAVSETAKEGGLIH